MNLSLPIKHLVEISCENCDELINIQLTIDELEFESSIERGMGSEIQYRFTIEVQCPYCGQLNTVRGELWEYPEGVVNLIQLDLNT